MASVVGFMFETFAWRRETRNVRLQIIPSFLPSLSLYLSISLSLSFSFMACKWWIGSVPSVGFMHISFRLYFGSNRLPNKRTMHVCCNFVSHNDRPAQMARFMGPTWGPPGSCRPQMGPMLAPWTLLSGKWYLAIRSHSRMVYRQQLTGYAHVMRLQTKTQLS